MNPSYNVNVIFADMEHELVKSYKRNMSRHAKEELKEGFKWEMWQAQKLRDLHHYRAESRVIIDKATKQAKLASNGIIVDTYGRGIASADKILRGVTATVGDGAFGVANRRKLDALLDAVNNDMGKATESVLRLVDDEYRQVIFKAQVMNSAGVKTLPQAIDMAAKDFLMMGINSVIYSNGAKVNVASYAEMALRASDKKAYLTGEGARCAELGVFLTQITSYGACSPICLPWQGRVYLDDVFAGGVDEGKYPLLSEAMANGLFHPNCRHTAQPWFEGISYPPREQDTQAVNEMYKQEQTQRNIERHIRQWKRVAEGSIDPVNQGKAQAKVKTYQAAMRNHLSNNPELRRAYSMEK